MERQEIADKVLAFVRKALAKKDVKIDPAASLVNQGLNSSGRLELFTMIEDEWDLMLDEDETDGVKTLNDAIDMVERALA